MIKQFLKGKTAVFIDAANIFYSQKTLKWRIDYEKLSSYLHKEADITGIYYYTGMVGVLEKQKAFVSKLQMLGYRVTTKEVKFIKVAGSPDIPKGNLDVELALDAFRLKDNFETLILFSGDSDFAYLLDLLKQKGKYVIVVSMRGHISRELLQRAKYVPLPKLRHLIEKIKEPDEPAPEV
ncbi:NYN domain-containing protein [Candidatus Kaiserbacteria bacterium]|nr:NYN domain-containing protein [Candidatus Kaiserbacteria bacterium]